MRPNPPPRVYRTLTSRQVHSRLGSRDLPMYAPNMSPKAMRGRIWGCRPCRTIGAPSSITCCRRSRTSRSRLSRLPMWRCGDAGTRIRLRGGEPAAVASHAASHPRRCGRRGSAGVEPGRAAVVTLGFTGLRWGELVGLETAYVRLASVRVEWQLYELDTGELHRGPPKDDSYRTVHVPGWLGSLLTAHLGRRPVEACACQDTGTPSAGTEPPTVQLAGRGRSWSTSPARPARRLRQVGHRAPPGGHGARRLDHRP